MHEFPSLDELAEHLTPEAAQRDAIKRRVRARIEAPVAIWDAARVLDDDHSKIAVWSKIMLRDLIWSRLQPRLVPAHAVARVPRFVRAGAIVTLAVLILRATPLVFLPSHTLADSPVTVLPTRGQASILMAGLWQPVTREINLQQSAMLQTQGEGEATLVHHDDVVVRLGANTTFAVHDLSDRPANPEHEQTFTLHGGRAWLQGFVPAYASHGIMLQTSEGTLVLHEGSVSVSDDQGVVEITVWNRRATVLRGSSVISLIAGERLRLWEGNIPSVERVDPSEYEEASVRQNLRRDAVHRREIAHLQQERHAAAAGILPTSPLYSVKRVAEEVDVLFTFSEEGRVRKRLGQAQTRLNEAAALLSDGQDEATASLEEFRETVLSVASGTGDNVLVRHIVSEQLAQANADLAAARPSDDLYALKETVLETSAAVTDDALLTARAEEVRVTDTVSDLTLQMGAEDAVNTEKVLTELQPILTTLENSASPLSEEVREEVKASLSIVTGALAPWEEEEAPDEEIAQISLTPQDHQMTQEELATYVQAVEHRIFTADDRLMRRQRLLTTLRALEDNPNQGPILRRLARELPQEGLAQYVEMEIVRLRKERSSMPR